MKQARGWFHLLLALVALCHVPYARAAGLTGQFRGGTPLALRDLAGGTATWQIRLDDKLGTPAALLAPPGTSLGGGDAAQAGEAWFEANRASLGLGPAEALSFGSERHDGATRHLFFEQRHAGIPVEGGGYMLTLRANGEVSGMIGRVVPIRQVANQPTLDGVAARPFALRALHMAAGEVKAEGGVRLIVENGVARYARRVTVMSEAQPATLDLDAQTGAVLQRVGEYDLTTGNGTVYDHDGGGALVQHPLSRLADPGTSLTGQYVTVQNMSGTNVSGPGAQYIFNATQIHELAQVNVYYHIDRLMTYLVGLGYPAPQTPIIARANQTVGNAGFFSPTDLSVNYHVELPPTANTGLDAGSVAHEVGHYVAYSLGVTSVAGESGALHEGLGHYFAATYLNDPVLYVWFENCNTNPPNPPQARLDSDKSVWNYAHYNQVNACSMPYGDPHANGLIVASALWDLRVSAGATRADALLLKALPYCPPAPDFGCLFDALWMADIDYFNFEDALNILHAGLDRGIRCIPVVSITGSAVVNVGVQNTWTASMQCPARPTGFTWSLRHYCGGAPCEDWQEVGWDPEFVDTENSPGSLELKVVSLDDGGRTDTETKMVSVYYPMSVSIGGDNSIQACVVGTWCVSVIGHGPFTYQWRHNDSVVNGATSSCYSTSDIHNFTVACTVTDADGQQITRTKPVTVTGVCPPDIVAEVTEVQTAPSGGLKLAIVSGPGGLARISLFDVAGRRAVPDWNGVLKPGRQTLTLGEGQAHKGVYFYRVEMGSQTKRGTVVLLH